MFPDNKILGARIVLAIAIIIVLHCCYAEQNQETSFHKKKEMDGSMNALADKVQTSAMHTVICTELHTMAILFNNHPYISSSGTLVGTKFTAAFVCHIPLTVYID